MAEQNDSLNSEEKISSFEYQVTKVNNDHPASKSPPEPKDGTGPYMKMLRVSPEPPTQLYPYNSCVCARCGAIFATPEEVMIHWQHSPKCNYRSVCEECTKEGVSEYKQCKHFDHIPRVVLLDSHHIVNYEEIPASGESEETDYQPPPPPPPPSHPQPRVVELPLNDHSSSRPAEKRPRPPPARSTSDEENEKKICHLPPPPNGDPQKPLPYRIDFLLDSGVIKHARINSNANNPLLFEKKRPRKPRTHFTNGQVEELEKIFEDKKYLDAKEREVVAVDLNLAEEQVKNWFQNRRSKWRKDIKEGVCV